MQVHTVEPNIWLQYGLPLLIAAIVLSLRARRISRMRPLKIERLWIVPALYLVLVASLFAKGLPTPTGWLICVVALAAGAAIGWQRGKMMEIHVDPETHALNQKGSIGAILFIGALIVVKMAAQQGGQAFHFNVVLLTDALAALALGMFTAQRVEMYIRAKKLLEAARAAKAATA